MASRRSSCRRSRFELKARYQASASDRATVITSQEKSGNQIIPLRSDSRFWRNSSQSRSVRFFDGRKVLLGNSYADLIAVEPAGRTVVIEIKLVLNSDAWRAIVGQILTYAACFLPIEP